MALARFFQWTDYTGKRSKIFLEWMDCAECVWQRRWGLTRMKCESREGCHIINTQLIYEFNLSTANVSLHSDLLCVNGTSTTCFMSSASQLHTASSFHIDPLHTSATVFLMQYGNAGYILQWYLSWAIWHNPPLERPCFTKQISV